MTVESKQKAYEEVIVPALEKATKLLGNLADRADAFLKEAPAYVDLAVARANIFLHETRKKLYDQAYGGGEEYSPEEIEKYLKDLWNEPPVDTDK